MINVMIVEDEVSTLNLMKIIVNWEEFGMKITAGASNGREALFLIAEQQPDLVVTDIKMPLMDGLELAQELQRTYPQIRVMMVTAYDDIKLAQQAMRLGAVDFILKPLKRQEIRDALARLQEQFEKERTTSEKPELIEEIKNYLEENYHDSSLCLTQIAENFYLNPSYLSRMFHKKQGMNLIEYLNRIRIAHACDYLKEGNWKIYQIAEKVGLPNPDYFTKCFRRVMGVSVRDYRKGKNSAENSQNNPCV